MPTNDCRTTAVALPQRRCLAAVPPKGVRLPSRILCIGADCRSTGRPGWIRALAWTLGGLLVAALAAELVPVGIAVWKNGRGEWLRQRGR
jgi:hypothetical protein